MTGEKKWNPKCLTENKPFASTADGYLIPCCWCDKVSQHPDLPKDPLLADLFDEELKTEHNSISHILKSKQWKRFYKAIKLGYEYAPKRCQYYCYRINEMQKKSL